MSLPVAATSSRYAISDLIGEGGYAAVFKAIDRKDQKIVAVKHMRFHGKKEGFPYDIMREISLLRELIHPNVVRLFNVEKLSCLGCQLIFEYGQCDLSTYIRKHSDRGIEEATVKSILVQIFRALNYCHFQKVMHRDLKPRNILLDPDGVVKVADFGLSRTFDVPLLEYSVEVGTLPYRALEILLELPSYTNSIDVWAVGCIFAELVTRKPLFEGNSEFAIVRNIIRIFGMPNETEFSKEAISQMVHIKETMPTDKSGMSLASLVPGLTGDGLDLLQKMLRVNPSERITATNALLHPFFKEFNHTARNLLSQDGEDPLRDYVEF